MIQKYIVSTLGKAGGVEVGTLRLLDASGVPITGAELRISQPKGGGLYGSFDDGDVVEVSFTKVTPAETPTETTS